MESSSSPDPVSLLAELNAAGYGSNTKEKIPQYEISASAATLFNYTEQVRTRSESRLRGTQNSIKTRRGQK
jgi:hypothetical protein